MVKQMNKYYVNNHWYCVNELAEISGIRPHTIRARLRCGYPVEEAIKEMPTHTSVVEFCAASLWEDWIDKPMSSVHEIYYNWCIKHSYSPISIQLFSRQIMRMYPMLKVIPIKKDYKSYKVIRRRAGV